MPLIIMIAVKMLIIIILRLFINSILFLISLQIILLEYENKFILTNTFIVIQNFQ